MHVQTMVCGPVAVFPKKIRECLLLIHRQVCLRSAEEAHAPFTDDDGKVSDLLLRVVGVKNVPDLCLGVFASDDGRHLNVVEVVQRPRVFKGLVDPRMGGFSRRHWLVCIARVEQETTEKKFSEYH